MQTNEQMHPEDKRNLIIFIVISLLLWFAYDHFILKPRFEAQKQAQQAAALAAKSNLPPEVLELEQSLPREEVIAKTPRVKIDNGMVFGSINLEGGRLDDISLHKYYKELDKKEKVSVLSPSGTSYAFYSETGWVAIANEKPNIPNKDTVWSVVGGANSKLTKETPVTLYWENGQGLRFERQFSVDDKYMFSIKEKIINSSPNDISLSPYALVTEQGLPEDFKGRVVVHEGPVGYIGNKLEERKYQKMAKQKTFTASATQGWVGITQKYWLAAIIPAQGEEVTYRYVYSAPPTEKAKERYQVDAVGTAKTIPAGESIETSYHLFAGAKEVKTLSAYERDLKVAHLDLAVDFGLFYFLTRPFFFILHALYSLAGNFGIAIILITVLLRLAVFPLANTSYKSFAKLRQVSPLMFELRQKYASDKQKLQEELVKLYQKEKVNPAAGCLPILVQIPIFFALFKVLSISIEMRHQPFFGWIQDLSAPDPTSLFNLFGLIPWSPPDFLMIGIWPCLMLLTMIIQRHLSPPPQDEMQAKMITYMPYFMTFILAKFASGLVIYWTFSNLFSVIQQYIIMKNMGVEPHLFSKDKNKEKLEEAVKHGPAVHPSAEMIEHEIEDAVDAVEGAVEKVISPPKPKKKKKK